MADLRPKRVGIFLTAISIDGDIDETVASVIDDAESRGMFMEWAAIGDMDLGDVVPGSPLHKALNGEFPNR